MQVVSVGFVIGVIQDSCETALNSSTDVLFTAVAEMSSWPKENAINFDKTLDFHHYRKLEVFMCES